MDIEKKLLIMGKNKVLQFIKNIEDAPLLTLMLNLFEAVSKDADYIDKVEELNKFIDQRISRYYEKISDIESVHKIAFNVSKNFKFLKSFTNLSIEELCKKYNLKLIDKNNVLVSEHRLQELSESFYESEELYNLHWYIYDDIMYELANFLEEYYDEKLMNYLEYYI